MRSARVLKVALVSAVLAIGPAAGGVGLDAAQAAKAMVRCHGKVATIVGTQGDDSLRGTSGDDVIAGLGGIDDISGRGGDDLICGGPTPRRLDGHGYPVWEYLDGGTGDDHIFGGDGRDWFYGGPGADRLSGNDGKDLILGGQGDDRIEAGPGHDLVDYVREYTIAGAPSHRIPVSVDLTRGVASARWFGHDHLAGIEEVWTGWGDDHLVGSAGADTFNTSLGHDVIHGRGGSDTISFDYAATVDLTRGRATVDGGAVIAGHLRLFSIENVVGSEQADTIVGNSHDNVLVGGHNGHNSSRYDTDVIRGLGGDDDISGGNGDDTLDGGTGLNTLDGGRGTDTCTHPTPASGAIGCELPG